jgi:hypothetical protein
MLGLLVHKAPVFGAAVEAVGCEDLMGMILLMTTMMTGPAQNNILTPIAGSSNMPTEPPATLISVP